MILIILLLGMNNIINRSSIEELLMTNEFLTFINGVYDWLIDWLIDWLVDWLIDWLIDWVVFYAVSVIFQPYNGGKYTKVNVGVILCPLHGIPVI